MVLAMIIVGGLIFTCILGYLWFTGKLLDKSKVKDRDAEDYKLK